MPESVTNPRANSLLQPGTLWGKTQQQTKFARECGALKSIETNHHLIQQGNISFVVRTLGNLARKEKAKKKQAIKENKTGKRFDPFLPYETDLFVGDVSESHICILNKFNVVDNHLLIVTRAFEEQTDLLNLEDFVALWTCLQEVDGLAFYNGGKTAGASQRHKHLQLIPLPFMPNVVHLPIEKAMSDILWQNSLGNIEYFPFHHGFARLEISNPSSTEAAAEKMFWHYRELMNWVGLNINRQSQKQPGAYNFLATRNWMLIVPRSQDSYENIPINSLGFAGSLFVRDRDSLEFLQKITPLKLLEKVAFPKK